MASLTISKRRDKGRSTSKQIHQNFRSLDSFFKVTGLAESTPKTKTISFKAAVIQTRGYKFNREEANGR